MKFILGYLIEGISNLIIILQIKCFLVDIILVIDKREEYKRAIQIQADLDPKKKPGNYFSSSLLAFCLVKR